MARFAAGMVCGGIAAVGLLLGVAVGIIPSPFQEDPEAEYSSSHDEEN